MTDLTLVDAISKALRIAVFRDRTCYVARGFAGAGTFWCHSDGGVEFKVSKDGGGEPGTEPSDFLEVLTDSDLRETDWYVVVQ